MADNFHMYFTLAVLIFMIASFLIHKFSYGMTTLTCAIALALAGVISPNQAFSGFSNSTLVLVACMFVIAGSLAKTSLVSRIKQRMSVIQNKSGTALVVIFILFTIALCQLVGQSAVVSIMIVLVEVLDDESETCQSRMLFLVPVTIAAWMGRFPIGMGAALPSITNAFYVELVGEGSEELLGMFDILKAGLIPSIALTIYCVLAWRLIPKQPIDQESAESAKKKNRDAAISKRDEMIILGVFLAIMAAFCMSNQLGDYINLIPAIGVLILLYTGVMTTKEVVAKMTATTTWMIAGMLVVSSALGTSGAGELVGKAILSCIGNTTNGLVIMLVFSVATVIVTNMITNTTTLAIMVPIAASTALAGGMNVKALVVTVFVSAYLAVALPTGSASCILAYGIGRYNPAKLLKFTLPYLIIGVITTVFSANLLFPLYG